MFAFIDRIFWIDRILPNQIRTKKCTGNDDQNQIVSQIEFTYMSAVRFNPIFLHSEIWVHEISIKFCFLDILTKPKACITHSSAILT